MSQLSDPMQTLEIRSLPKGREFSPILPSVSAEVMLVTPEMASQWLAELDRQGVSGPKQRPLDAQQVIRLSHAIMELEWEPTMIILYEFEGRTYLIDGQHRLNAIAKAGMPAPLIVEIVRAETIQQVYDAYRRIDVGKYRPPLVGIVGGRLHEGMGLASQEAKLGKFLGALKIIMNGFANSTAVGNRWIYKDADTLLRGMYQWQEEARAYFSLAEKAHGKYRDKILAAPVFAVALVTLRDAGRKTGAKRPAETFWEQVISKAGLQSNSGAWHAADLIPTFQMRNVADVSRMLASCWNAYQNDERPMGIRGTDRRQSIRLVNTIYKGGPEPIRESFDA